MGWWFLASAAVSAIGGAAASRSAKKGQRKQFQWEQELAQLQRDYQTRMVRDARDYQQKTIGNFSNFEGVSRRGLLGDGGEAQASMDEAYANYTPWVRPDDPSNFNFPQPQTAPPRWQNQATPGGIGTTLDEPDRLNQPGRPPLIPPTGP